MAEVKGTGESGSTGGWMAKTRLWMAGILAAAAVAGIGLWFAGNRISSAEKLAKLAARAQNLIVFDAAVDLLKANYYDHALFHKPGWKEYEIEWREKAATSQGGEFLYWNVLANFGARFPDSHLSFQVPASLAAPPPSSTDEPAPDPAAAAQFQRNAAMLKTGPGFDMAFIRRAGKTPLVVGEIVRGSPADRAGVTPGWVVEKYNVDVNPGGVHFKGTFFSYTPAMVREVERTGLPIVTTAQQELDDLSARHAVELAFDYEPLPARTDFESRTLVDGIAYLRFNHFNDVELVGRVLDAIDAAGPAGLVIDLRGNSGGLMEHMVRVAGKLLGGGVEIGKTRWPGSSVSENSVLPGDDFYRAPLVLLIGPSSSSGAEMIAAAVQDHRRGTLIGRTTNGSVVVAKTFTLPDGGAMTIPVRDFVRSGDRRIEGAGVEPDIWILPTLEDIRAGRDPVLEHALAKLRE